MQTKSGAAIHPIGIGCWDIGNNPGDYNQEQLEREGLTYSLDKGQNHIDTAEMYSNGHSEELVGQVIKNRQRDKLYIASKLWRHSLTLGRVRPAVVAMLERLQTDYLDMLYIHAPWQDSDWQGAIPQICNLIDERLVRNFGISNFGLEDMKIASSLSRYPITANQLHYNCLYKADVPPGVRNYCSQNKIEIVAYSPIARSKVSSNLTLGKISERYQATASQIALAWVLAKDAVPIPKAIRKEHIDENLGSLKIKLSPEDITSLDNL